MPKIKVGEINFYYESHGYGDPVLLVTGLNGVASYWLPQVSRFAEHYRVIVHDHRGAGQSDCPIMKYTVDQMAEDVLKLMDALGIERAHLVGHSTGGAIGQTIAIEKPERLRSLVIVSSWTKADAFLYRLFEMRKQQLRTGGAAAYMQASFLILYPNWWIRDNAKCIEEEEKAGIAEFPPVEVVLSRIEAILAFDRTKDLHTIKTPTLVMCAKDDFAIPSYFSEELAASIPGAKLMMLECGGHFCSKTVSEEFNEIVLKFLAAH